MTRTQIQIETGAGTCPANVYKPAGAGPFPALLFFIDGIGMRPAMHEMGERMAAGGYYVLQPDLFWRAGAYTAPVPKELFSNPEAGKAWFGKMFQHASPANVMADMKSYVAHFDAQPDVAHGKLGITGYCMGGRLAIIAAETFPEQVAAVAAFHPGGLVTDQADSPHRAVGKIKGRVYVGGAKDDGSFPDDARAAFDKALTDAHVRHQVELYPASHGWVPSDTPIHDPAQCERHYQALFGLLEAALK
jgi:carboxymethylenebutenolidase